MMLEMRYSNDGVKIFTVTDWHPAASKLLQKSNATFLQCYQCCSPTIFINGWIQQCSSYLMLTNDYDFVLKKRIIEKFTD